MQQTVDGKGLWGAGVNRKIHKRTVIISHEKRSPFLADSLSETNGQYSSK